MGVNDVLKKFFNLPPHVKMMLAVMGFGSLASMLFFVLPVLRTRQARIWLLIIFAIAIAIFVVIWLLRRMFAGRKSSELSSALESQGPTRGDIAEQERIYKEKFKAKLNELRANGLSVYKLPWFILMGEPGCGKTASLIHSGLDFPLGKDEVPGFGGTRNYNWWFTNEAVILDTAGRIAFHEEGTTDKPEWEYFLKMLKKHRPRCPLNGLILALPADKLLRDTSEERANKATILRERLRQVHQILGVRFPTFLLVTKMDLAGGFAEFFEEIRVDLVQRNQMFGWSRPGEFQEPYDPSAFPATFDDVYTRLRDWAMRYLQRKATDQELGMIVTFPEAFRQLRDPLNDYIATIFQKSPLLEPPFFRGFYFTSAVQEGAPIFDVFARTAKGTRIAERPTRAVDSKAFFIHDFYQNKVFAEHGLVFRSARHVTLNKRMRRMVWAGGMAMFAIMLAFFTFGYFGITSLVTNPRQDCTAAAAAINSKEEPPTFANLSKQVELAQKLKIHYDAYDKPWAWMYARALFIGANINTPRNYVRTIHASYVLSSVLHPVLRETEKRIAEFNLLGASPDPRKRFVRAIEAYTEWFGELTGQHQIAYLTEGEARRRAEQFDVLLAFLEVGEEDRKAASAQVEAALASLSAERRFFAREILRDQVKIDQGAASELIIGAIKRLKDSWLPITVLRADHENDLVRYWSRFAEALGRLRERYEAVLALTDRLTGETAPESAQQYLALTKGVEILEDMSQGGEPGTLKEAYFDLVKFLVDTPVPETPDKTIIRLSSLLGRFETEWNKEFDPIENALAVGAPRNGAPALPAQVYRAIDEGRGALRAGFEASLAQLRERLGVDKDGEPLAYYEQSNLFEVKEAKPPMAFTEPHATIRLAAAALGPGDPPRVKAYLWELRKILASSGDTESALNNLKMWPNLLGGSQSAVPSEPALRDWFAKVAAQPEPTPKIKEDASGIGQLQFWQPVRLYALADAAWNKHKVGSTRALLERMAQKANETAAQTQFVGVARLMEDYAKPDTDLPFNRHRFNSAVASAAPRPVERAQPQETPKPPQPAQSDDPFAIPAAPQQSPPSTPPADTKQPDGLFTEAPAQADNLLARYHTRGFLIDTLATCAQVKTVLKQHDGSQPAIDALDKAATAYVHGYFSDWFAIYSTPTKLLDETTLSFLEKCRDGAYSWPQYVQTLSDQRNAMSAGLGARMASLTDNAIVVSSAIVGHPLAAEIGNSLRTGTAGLLAENRSLPHLYGRQFASAGGSPGESPAANFANRIRGAWFAYTTNVAELGPLEGGKKPGGGPPNIGKLRNDLVGDGGSYDDTFPLVAPLVKLGEYGQELLTHHLDSEFSRLIGSYAGQFPILSGGVSAGMASIPTEKFLALLNNAREFRASYGALYDQLKGSSGTGRTLAKIDEWMRFLYGDASASGDPPPLGIELGCITVAGFTPASVYDIARVKLPLSASGAPLDKEVRTTQIAEDVSDAFGRMKLGEYSWSLKGSATPARTQVELVKKNERAKPAYPDSVRLADLPGDPWSLLTLIGSGATKNVGGNIWIIPISASVAGDTVGFGLAVRIGGGRTFPGTIDPPPSPGERPKMIAANAFLRR